MSTPTDDQIDQWFSYHAPSTARINDHETVRKAGAVLARAIARCVPDGDEQDASLMRVREAVALANAGIACAPKDQK